jgi:hypothetical protein
MIDILLFITVQLQARLRANHLRYQQLITVAVVRGFAQLQKFVTAIAPEVGAEKLGSESLSFYSLCYPIVRRIFDSHFVSARPIASCGDDHVFRCALYWSLYQATPRRRVRFSPVPESQVEERATRLATSCGPIRGLCDERVRSEGKGTALGTALGVT